MFGWFRKNKEYYDPMLVAEQRIDAYIRIETLVDEILVEEILVEEYDEPKQSIE